MKHHHHNDERSSARKLPPRPAPRTTLLAGCCAALTLLSSSCGGGGGGSTTSTETAAAAPLPADIGSLVARPSYHLAPVLLDTPADAADPATSAHAQPHQQQVPAEFGGLSSKRLTLQAMTGGARRAQALSADATGSMAGTAAQASATSTAGVATPMAGTTYVSTYTPAQIRSAYGLPELPAAALGSVAALSAQAAAQLGAGQTIYIVNAMHDPHIVAELDAFNQKFALPTCSVRAVAVNTTLPLAPATAADGCTFSVVYGTASGTMRSTAPAYDASWATEIALDVQWAHATAPLARIILIEAPDASLDGLTGAVKLANAMGPGVVSMSFGAGEGGWTSRVDASTFSTAQMSYLAATGDWGAEVNWPAVSPKVLAVGGTRLVYSGAGARSETGWSGTGGGVSAYVATPDYQKSGLPGVNSLARRGVADVAFNADPGTGQYVAILSPGANTPNWVSAGGTSLSTPQWAGVVAIANAQRALAGKAPVGLAHTLLYGDIGAQTSRYASAFADITSGSNGPCASCSARSGYDPLTGLGTPNTSALLTLLSGAGDPAPAPVVGSGSISAYVGLALNFSVQVNNTLNPVSYTLAGAPTGMTITSNGTVSWPKPVLGTVAVTVSAKDSRTGLSGSGVYTISVAPAPVAPTVTPANVTGKAGTAISYSVNYQASNPLSWTLTRPPAGMTISSTGVVDWPKPTAGDWTVVVTAKDTRSGLSGSNKLTLHIEAVPTLTGTAINGKERTALSFKAVAEAGHAVSYALDGAPDGMVISAAGLVSWAAPVPGSWSVKVTATDTVNHLSGSAVWTVKVVAVPLPPVIEAAALNGKVGAALSGLITVSDPKNTGLSISITGVPLGMTIDTSAFSTRTLAPSFPLYWASPVAGKYAVKIVARNGAGLSTTATLPISIVR